MSTRVIEWRGPAPYYFAPLPDDAVDALREVADLLTYGWGCLYADATLLPGGGGCGAAGPARPAGPREPIDWRTALMPHDGGYVVPLKNAVRKPAGLDVGDPVEIVLHLPNP